MEQDLVTEARHGRRRPRHLVRKIVGGSLAVAILGIAGFGVVTYVRAAQNIADHTIARPGATATQPTIPDWKGPVDLLIMGSDQRVGLAGDYGKVDGARSDVMMLLHVSADRSNAVLVSIPRDTMVPIPQCTKADGTVVPARRVAMVNSALEAGPYCSLDTIRQLTGLDLQHFIVVDFDGVVSITDAIGGVDVCVAHDVDDRWSGLHLTAGEHTIQGDEALAFLRTRHGFGDGSDLGRIAAQQSYLSSLARKAKSAGVLTNPVALFSLADAATKAINVDEGLGSPSALVALAGTLASIDLDKIVLVQLPVRTYPQDHNRVEPIPDQTSALFAALVADRAVALAGETPPASPSAPSAGSPTGEPGAISTAPPPVELPTGTRGQTAATATCAGQTR